MSHRSLSSILLASSVISSDSDYHSCLDEMPTELEQTDELLPEGSEVEEPVFPLEDDDQLSTLQLFSVPPSPISSLLPPLPFFSHLLLINLFKATSMSLIVPVVVRH